MDSHENADYSHGETRPAEPAVEIDDELMPQNGRPASASDSAPAFRKQQGQPRPKKAKRWHDWGAKIDDSWSYEIISIFFSLCCMVTMAVVLGTVDNKPLSVWTSRIQLNALVAIFSVAAKSSLIYTVAECIGQFKWLYFQSRARQVVDLQIFDDASRGPWGATLFLLHIKRFKHHAILASLASIITILALATEPFSQQILEFPLHFVSVGQGSALTQGARGFNSKPNVGFDVVSANDIDPGMQGVILAGVYGNSGDPPYTCSSGNCTYSDVSTLAICQSCQNVTSDSTSACTPMPPPGKGRTCEMITPGGLRLPTRAGVGIGVNTLFTRLSSVAVATNFRSPVNAENASVVTRLAVWKDDDTITECQISFCERTYSNFSVTNGQTKPPIVTETKLHLADLATEKISDSYQRVDTYSFNTSEPGKESHDYQINGADLQSVSLTLVDLFNVTLYGGLGFPSTGENSFRVSKALYNANISELVANLADRMTDYIRAFNTSGVIASGEAFHEEPFIHVRWPWFILPGGLSVCGAAILAAAMALNRKHRGRLWKSSVLPFLFHPLYDARRGGDATLETGWLERLSEMDRISRRMDAKLESIEDEGLKLVLSS